MGCLGVARRTVFISVCITFTVLITVYDFCTDLEGNKSDLLVPQSDDHSFRPSWADRLYAPTYITKIDNVYLLVDSWHHRVIYSENLTAPLSLWHNLDEHNLLWIPHSIATNGGIFIVESSDHGSHGHGHSLVVYRIRRLAPGVVEGFTFHQRVRLCPGKELFRPHRVAYDATMDLFFIYITSPPTLGKYKWSSERQTLQHLHCEELPFMEGVYARSFIIVKNEILFTAGPRSSLTRAVLSGVNGTTKYVDRISLYRIGMKTGSMNDIFYHDKYWYLSSTYPCSLLRLRSLKSRVVEQLHKKVGLCGDASQKKVVPKGRCKGVGTPYYISFVDGRIMVPFLFQCNGVLSFDPTTQSTALLWGLGWKESPVDVKRRGLEW